MAFLLRGDLNPPLGFFSPIFHEFRSGISIGVEICGTEWNQNCSFFVIKLLTKFSCVLDYCDFHHGDLKNPSIMRFALWGLKTLGAPLANPLTSGGAVRIDLSPRGSVLVLRLRITAVPC